ncbi:MAG: alpha-glucosidase/alpha-galactosidase [Candidatus Sumerlaeia bacterium]
MIKIAMIGAGSVVFTRNLTGDILQFPEFKDATMTYMDIDEERLETGGLLCKKVAKALGIKPKIETTMDRKKALEGADFVINMVQIGGFDSTLVDFEIPRKYGLNFTIADTTGPGGFFRALRTYPLMRDLARDMEKICPNAVMLNYSNPMSMNMQSVFRTSGIQATGLCHSVQGTFNGLMRYIGESPDECSFICAGINHMAFFLRLEKEHEDLYPRLFKAMEDENVRRSNPVRFELMKRLGYFVTESSEHHAEYNPWFIPRGKDMIKRFNVPIDEYLRRCDTNTREFEHMKDFAHSDKDVRVRRSHEYGSLIIHSMSTGTPRVVYGNLPNNGAISNLPDNAVVEVPTLVDRAGLQATVVGELPPQLIGYIMPHVVQHELFIRAVQEGKRDHVYQAAMADPMTSAILNLDQIVEMCDELIAAHGKLLPKMDKPTLVPTSGKKFKGVRKGQFMPDWEKRKAEDLADFILKWDVIGPFMGTEKKRPLVDWTTPLDKDFAKSEDGSVDLKASYQSAGEDLKWQKAEADIKGFVLLHKLYGLDKSNAVAYGYAETIMPESKEVLLTCGSSNGIKIWVNGKEVHSYEGPRGFLVDDDEMTVRLQAGVNRILVKCSNFEGRWGYCLALRKLS